MNSPSLIEIPLWFESNSHSISIWEGVCAVKSNQSFILYKILNDELLQIDVNHFRDLQLISTGYWSCAEIQGIFGENSEIFYHSQNPERALEMLNIISLVYSSKISHLRVRFDPDPLREKRKKSIYRRAKKWKSLGQKLQISDFQVIWDRNMPIG